MKKEVSPAIVVVLVLVALTTVQFIYWRGLVGAPIAPKGGPPPDRGGGGAAAEAPPAGLPECTVTTLAGALDPGYRDGAAAQARFDGPAAVAVAGGSVYVADSRNHAIRKIAADGEVSTVAGAPGRGFGGFADGPAAQARFSAPAGVAVLPDGGLLVADTGNHRLRRISRDGVVTTFAGADTPHDELGRPTGGYRDGAAAQAEFRYPAGLAVAGDGTVYVADAGNQCVRRVAGGVVSTVAVGGGKMDTPTQVALAGGQLWVSDAAKSGLWAGPPGGPLRWRELKGAGGRPFSGPAGIAGVGGGLCLLDAGLDSLYEMDGGSAVLLAGEQGSAGYADGTGDAARFAQPAGLAVAGGTAYIADFGNNCIRTATVQLQQ
jgi:DNA-binding beta-propeller fold protein YncE